MVLQRQWEGMEKTEHAAFYMYQKMVFLTYPLNPKAVEGVGGDIVCSQVTGVQLRGAVDSSPYSPHSQARFLLILLHLPKERA